MVLSQRERYVLIATVAAVALFLGDRYVLAPILSHQARLDEKKQSLVGQLEHATALFKGRKGAEARWKEMTAGGLKADAAEAESALLHSIREWSQEASLTLSAVRPERAAAKGKVTEVIVLVNGSGPMSAVSRFLWRLQTSAVPVKIVEMQLSARREGADDLSVQLRLSALYLPAGTKAVAAKPAAVAGEARP